MLASMPLLNQALQQPRHWACRPRSRRPAVFVCASSAQEEPSTSEAYQFTYRGSDGRLKATFEQAFKGGQAAGAVGGAGAPPAAPWALGYQMAEKNLAWNDDLKARLIERVVAERLGLSDEETAARLRQLTALLPTLQQKIPAMKPQLVARLLENVGGVAAAMLQLKDIFPEADVATLAAREPGLVLGFDMARLERAAAELRQMLPRLNVDKLVEENPSMLDVEGFRAAVAEAQRIVPGIDVQQKLATDPQMIFGFQRGGQLIPYDEPRPMSPEEQQQEQDEYGAYYKW